MPAYLKVAERRALARAGAKDMMRGGTVFHHLSLRALAEHLGWSVGTLHRAYSVVSGLLNDLLLEFEDETTTLVYRVGDGGLDVELRAQASRMYEHLADPANLQLLRYEMVLGCRSEQPFELDLQHGRSSAWAFTRQLLGEVGARSGEEYRDLDGLSTFVSAMRGGSAYQLFDHGDRERWLSDSTQWIDLAVSLAAPRPVAPLSAVRDHGWGVAVDADVLGDVM